MGKCGFDVGRYWQDAARQDRKALSAWFWEDARINWPCTGESFSVEDFLRANCEYPGEWACEIERTEEMGDTLATAAHVYAKDGSLSCHAASFFKLRDGKISQLDEYWGDDGPPPSWRQEMRLGAGTRPPAPAVFPCGENAGVRPQGAPPASRREAPGRAALPNQEGGAGGGTFTARGHSFPLTRPYIMGILNVTPDSFSDGGRYLSPAAALARAKEMEREGADILDIGGQSTRPGHTPIPQEEEWERLQAVLPAVLRETSLPVSVDTFYPWVAGKALALGVHIINDVSGFPDGMFRAVAGSGCGCIVMCPTGGVPDIFAHVKMFFEGRLRAAERHGIKRERLCFDPGIGFGKTYEENLSLIAHVGRTRVPGAAYLMAASRKRVTGAPCGDPPFEKRLPATLAAHTVALMGGADILRVHDVAESVQAARMAGALRAVR